MKIRHHSLQSNIFLGVSFALILGITFFIPETAIAASWETAPQKLYNQLMGTFFGNLAALAIVGMAIAALAGKIDWRWAVGIVVSIVVAFSAPAIVDTIKSYVS